jgi:hypothetical protein
MTELVPLGGELHGRVFENVNAGVARQLYWSFMGEFAPIVIDESEWTPSVSVEWLTFPVRRWPELDGAELADVRSPREIEALMYFMDFHQPADLLEFGLRRLSGRRFEISAVVSCELEYLDGTRLPRASIAWRGLVELTRIEIVRSNLFPKPSTTEEAIAVLAVFIDPSDFSRPTADDDIFAFEPLEEAE